MNSNDIDLEQYIVSHIDPEPPLLAQIDRYTHVHMLTSRMSSGHAQGALLKMLVRMINPRLVLEIGTYTGYSALSMAEGLMRPDAHIHTVEINDELEDTIRGFFSRSALAQRHITLHIGDVADVIGTIGGMFDLIFIDGNKRDYPQYYRMAIDRLAEGGYIIADNVLWSGKVLDAEAVGRDAQTRGIAEFNDMVAADSRVEKVIVPMRDGLTIIRKI